MAQTTDMWQLQGTAGEEMAVSDAQHDQQMREVRNKTFSRLFFEQ